MNHSKELVGFFFVVAVLDHRDALAAKRRVMVAIRTGRVGEVAGGVGMRVRGRVGKRREERKVVHVKRDQTFGERLVVLGEKRLRPVRWRERVELAIGFQRVDVLLASSECHRPRSSRNFRDHRPR